MYKEILLPIDLGEAHSWDGALTVAIEYAQAFKSKLHVLSVIPDFGMSIVSNFFPSNFEEKAIYEAKNKLQSFAESEIPDDVQVECHLAVGTVYSEIIRVANQTDCDLIIIGSHRPELKDYLLGPNAARVVRHSPKSVLVVRN